MPMEPMPMAEQPQQTQQAAPPPQQRQGPNFISQENLVDRREVAYEGAFKDTAYNIFNIKFPDLIPSVVTFKVIKSAIDDGDAVGAFILQHQGASLYVPVVMSANQMKPMEVFYAKKLDKFLPFNKEWLNIVLSTGQQALGKGVIPPDQLPSDVDVTNLVRPPLDGMTSYAMDLSEIDHLDIIKMASNETKSQYKALLQDNKAYLKFAAEHFGTEALTDALRPHTVKTASVAQEPELTVHYLDAAAATLKATFGKQAGLALQKIAKDGYAYKDDRVNLDKVVSHDMKMTLEEPSTSGVYTLYKDDGRFEAALVVVDACDPLERGHEEDVIHRRLYTDPISGPRSPQFLVILQNGDYFTTENLVATPANICDFRGAVSDAVYGSGKGGSVTKSNMAFFCTDGKHLKCTKPVYISKTEVTKDGHKKYTKADDFQTSKSHIYNEKYKDEQSQYELLHADTIGGKIQKPAGTNLTIVPKAWKAVKLGDRIGRNPFLSNPAAVLRYVQAKLNDMGGKNVKVASVGANLFTVNGYDVGGRGKTAEHLAQGYNISMKTAEELLSGLTVYGDRTTFTVVPSREKNASIFSGGGNGTQLPPDLAQSLPPDQQAQPMAPEEAPPVAPEQPQPQDQAMMQTGVQTQDPELYGLGALNSLANNPDVRDLLAIYSPTLEKALDSVGRMLLVFWIRGQKTKAELGEETYFATEDGLRTTFKSLGSLLVRINRQSASMPDSTGM